MPKKRTRRRILITAYIFEQISKRRSQLLRLRDFDFFFRKIFRSGFVQGFHAQGQLAVLDSDNLYLYGVADLQDYVRALDTLFRNLGYMHQSGETVAQIDECAVGLNALDLSFRYQTDLYAGQL